jgi:hypothetical protein
MMLAEDAARTRQQNSRSPFTMALLATQAHFSAVLKQVVGIWPLCRNFEHGK